MTQAQVCLKAARLIEQHGLARGTRQLADGRLCVLGALGMAVHGDPWRTQHDVIEEIVRVLKLPNQYDAWNHYARDSPPARLAAWSNGEADEVVVDGLRTVARKLAARAKKKAAR